jgi:hypothetical protein
LRKFFYESESVKGYQTRLAVVDMGCAASYFFYWHAYFTGGKNYHWNFMVLFSNTLCLDINVLVGTSCTSSFLSKRSGLCRSLGIKQNGALACVWSSRSDICVPIVVAVREIYIGKSIAAQR